MSIPASRSDTSYYEPFRNREPRRLNQSPFGPRGAEAEGKYVFASDYLHIRSFKTKRGETYYLAEHYINAKPNSKSTADRGKPVIYTIGPRGDVTVATTVVDVNAGDPDRHAKWVGSDFRDATDVDVKRLNAALQSPLLKSDRPLMDDEKDILPRLAKWTKVPTPPEPKSPPSPPKPELKVFTSDELPNSFMVRETGSPLCFRVDNNGDVYTRTTMDTRIWEIYNHGRPPGEPEVSPYVYNKATQQERQKLIDALQKYDSPEANNLLNLVNSKVPATRVEPKVRAKRVCP